MTLKESVWEIGSDIVVSGDVLYRVMYILAFIGAIPLSILGVLFAEDTVSDLMLTEIGERNTIVVLAIVAAVFVSAVILIMVRYPVPRESALGLWVGLFSSALASIIFWGWLTYKYEYTTTLTLTFLDILLATMAILVALVTTTERI